MKTICTGDKTVAATMQGFHDGWIRGFERAIEMLENISHDVVPVPGVEGPGAWVPGVDALLADMRRQLDVVKLAGPEQTRLL